MSAPGHPGPAPWTAPIDRPRAAGIPRRPRTHDRVRLPVRGVSPTSSRSATATPIRRCPTGSRSPTASPATRRSACSTASRTTCSRSAATAPGASAGRWRSSPRCGGCWPPCARCGPRRTRAATELVLAGVVGRRTAFLVGARRRSRPASCSLWLGGVRRASSLAGLPAGGSAYLALATVSVVPVFVGVGAIASQLAPTRRRCARAGGRGGWLCCSCSAWSPTPRAASAGCAGPRRWGGPRSCVRSPARARLVLLLPLAASVLLLVLAARIAARPRHRQRGAPDARHAPHRGCGCCPLRSRRRCAASAAAWWYGPPASRVFAFILGVISQSISSAGISGSAAARAREARLRARSRPRPATSRSCSSSSSSPSACSRARRSAAARHEEAGEQLETLLALPVSRRALARRALAAGGAPAPPRSPAVCGAARLGGSDLGGASTSRWRGCWKQARTAFPWRSCSSGLAALAYATAPRASPGIAYGLVTVDVPVAAVRLAAGRAEMARRPDTLRTRRARPRPAVPRRRGGGDAGDRGRRRARRARRLPAPRPAGRLGPGCPPRIPVPICG